MTARIAKMRPRPRPSGWYPHCEKGRPGCFGAGKSWDEWNEHYVCGGCGAYIYETALWGHEWKAVAIMEIGMRFAVHAKIADGTLRGRTYDEIRRFFLNYWTSEGEE